MCGIAALLKRPDSHIVSTTLQRMTDLIAHRGPDDSDARLFAGTNGRLLPLAWSDSTNWTVGLGFRRLSIIDLTAAGRQPMSLGDRYWIIYNGEIYNYVELRAELIALGRSFHTTSDTEVILNAYAEWGPDCFRRFRGMWAIVVLDTESRQVILSRDPMGIKPLYIAQIEGGLAIISELKQLQAIPGFRFKLNHDAAREFLMTGYEDDRRCFIQDVTPLPDGTWTTIAVETLDIAEPKPYWHPERILPSIENGMEAAHLFRQKLDECCRIYIRSDVPVGCALSGGLDSSAITALVSPIMEAAGGTLHTFSMTFPGNFYDESDFINAALEKVHSIPTFVTPTEDRFVRELDKFIYHQDEPVGSASVFAGWCVAHLARENNVPVSINGQGGDEILAGYWQSYFLYLRNEARHNPFTPAAHFLGAAFGGGNPDLWGQIPAMLKRLTARRNPPLTVKGEEGSSANGVLKTILGLSQQESRLYLLRRLTLPRFLRYEDRNSMACSVEGRYPLLDHELIELCLSFQPSVLYHRGWTKMPLRIGLNGTLPEKVARRRSKFGFVVPQDRWLRGGLAPMIEHWLESDRPIWNLLDPVQVRHLWSKLKTSESEYGEIGQAIFRAFVFDRWAEIFKVEF